MGRLARTIADRRPRHRADPELERYVLDGERLVFAKRMHPMALWEPVTTAVVVLLAGGWLFAHLPAAAAKAHLADVLFWVMVLAVVRALWHWYEWAFRDRLVVTNKRIMLIHGFWDRDVPMMSLAKVTDLIYRRSIPARLLGYGMFVLESAGQDQALRTINYVPAPELTYRELVSEVFKVNDHARVLDDEPPQGPDTGGGGGDDGGPGGGGRGSGGRGSGGRGSGGRGGDSGGPLLARSSRAGRRDEEPFRSPVAEPWPVVPRTYGVPLPADPTAPAESSPRGARRDRPPHGSGSQRPSGRSDIPAGETLYRSADLEAPKADDTAPIPVGEDWWR